MHPAARSRREEKHHAMTSTWLRFIILYLYMIIIGITIIIVFSLPSSLQLITRELLRSHDTFINNRN